MPFPMAMLPRTLIPCASHASLRRALAYYGNLQTVSLSSIQHEQDSSLSGVRYPSRHCPGGDAQEQQLLGKYRQVQMAPVGQRRSSNGTNYRQTLRGDCS